MDVCTIIAKNYVAQARVLARSFGEHHVGGRVFLLVIDEFDGYLDATGEPFTILTPAQVGCEQFGEMALRYSLLELSTAVKPWLLRYLLREQTGTITYLDPDIRIYSGLDQLDRLARAHGVVLIPHNTEPLPNDGERPNQLDILLAGVYNLGYVSLASSPAVETLLTWWQERLLHDCRVDPKKGYFVDQRWFDLAPGLVPDHAIVREPQYNVAYWNLHGRRLEHDGSRYMVDGVPLAFFHFSGFDPGLPRTLSRHQSRIELSDGSPLASICREYADEVLAAGYLEANGWPYSYEMLTSEVKFTGRLRNLYEIARDRGEVQGLPFTPGGAESFIAWLGSPAPAAPPGVNRLMADMYGTREDLQEAFPDVGGRDHAAFLRWCRDEGVDQEPALALLDPLDEALTEDDTASEPVGGPRARSDDRAAESGPENGTGLDAATESWGVNVVGYFRSELGVGEAARQVVSALDTWRVPLLPVHGRTIPPNRQGHAFSYLEPAEARFPINLICMNADVLGEFAAQVGPGFFSGRYSIGMWFWEVERFPERWLPALGHLDELWLPTEHVAKALRAHSSIPVTKVTIPVELPPIAPIPRASLELPDEFLFLFLFDHHSVFERKNPLALIDAYRQAFGPDDGTALVIKSINAAGARSQHNLLIAAAHDRPDIHIIDGYVTSDERNAMLAACDCYVSLHRAEGFGLTMAEAMYLGKPVIATGYSGNLDFMSEDNSFLVRHRLVPIGPNVPPYPADGVWAEPDLDDATRLMREVFEQHGSSRDRGQRAAEHIREHHSRVAAGALMKRRLDTLRADRAHLAPAARFSSVAEPAARRAQLGPEVARSHWGTPGRLLRRLLFRLLKPYTVHQAAIDAELAREIATLDVLATERLARVLLDLRDDRPQHELLGRMAGLTRSVVALETATAELQRAVGELPDVPRRLEQLDSALKELVWESRAIPFTAGSPFVTAQHPVAGIVQGYTDDDSSAPHGYRSFEDTFRGSEEFIRERQRPYLAILDDRGPVLEFGCGRGEFLDLLRDAGLRSLGVDLDAGMVARCHEKGHEQVVQADGLRYLEGLDDASLGAIFCAQVIEHLEYEQLMRMLAQARLKLREDGLLIAETVNPHSPPALKTFWVDLTHHQPIFPEVALALCRDVGFASAYVFHPGGSGDIERDRFTEGAYAVVANTTEPLGGSQAIPRTGAASGIPAPG